MHETNALRTQQEVSCKLLASFILCINTGAAGTGTIPDTYSTSQPVQAESRRVVEVLYLLPIILITFLTVIFSLSFQNLGLLYNTVWRLANNRSDYFSGIKDKVLQNLYVGLMFISRTYIDTTGTTSLKPDSTYSREERVLTEMQHW